MFASGKKVFLVWAEIRRSKFQGRNHFLDFRRIFSEKTGKNQENSPKIQKIPTLIDREIIQENQKKVRPLLF